MKPAHKIFALVGAIFMAVGLMLTAIFFINRRVFGLWSLFPLFFAAFGFCFMNDFRRTKEAVIETGDFI
ncbi:MAG: hypothetical protein IJI23_05165 [Lachnospiraceae bacterium]|nr:hypothetical protein [Lachnospiraceae bacterium]